MSRRGAMVRWVVSSSLLTLSSCLLTTSFDGLTGTVQPPDAAAPDPVDGATPDVLAATDAPSPGMPFCKSLAAKPVFCVDFDGTGPVDEGWDGARLSQGDLSVDSSAFTSPTRSMVARTTGGSGDGKASVYRRFEVKPTEWHLSSQVRIDKSNRKGGIQILTTYVADATRVYQLALSVDDGGNAFFLEYSASPALYNQWQLAKPLALGAWTRIGIDVSWTSKTASVTVDGAVVLPPTVLSAPFPTTSIEVSSGIAFAKGPQDGWTMRFDDFTFDYR